MIEKIGWAKSPPIFLFRPHSNPDQTKALQFIVLSVFRLSGVVIISPVRSRDH